MVLPVDEAKAQWQAAWRELPPAERGSARAIFAFISERARELPDDWEGRAGDPWTTIHGWLAEADAAEGIGGDGG